MFEIIKEILDHEEFDVARILNEREHEKLQEIKNRKEETDFIC